MDIALLVLFVLTFASVLILPGANSGFAVGQSLKYGFWGSIFVPLGFASATGIHAVLVFSGVGVIAQEYAVILVMLKWLGVGYLLFLAYKAFTAEPSSVEVSPEKRSKLSMYCAAAFVSLTNPKALLASLMLYPVFLDPSKEFLSQAIILSVSAMIVSLTIYSGYSLIASLLKQRLSARSWANKLMGSLYLGAAGFLASK